MIGGMSEDRALQMAFLEAITAPEIERIETPERYVQLRKCKTELEEARSGSEGNALELLETVIARVSAALVAYEDADTHQIVNDMLGKINVKPRT